MFPKSFDWTLAATALLLTAACVQADSWGSEWAPMKDAKDSMLSRRSVEDDSKQAEAAGEGRNYAVQESEPIYSNDTDINQVIDQIINSRREGRNLGEYDQVYADGNIDQALQQGNDMEARNLIRDKLCGLGLMSCDVEEKRPYYSTIYAQGPPPPGFGGGPYGPPKPMPPPSHHFNSRPPPSSSLNSFGPPRKVGYEGPFKPNYRPSGPGPMYSGPYLENPPPSAIDGNNHHTFSKPPPGAIIYGSKPPGPVFTGHNEAPPYNFEHPVGEKIQVASSQQNNFYSQQSAGAASNFVVGAVPPSPVQPIPVGGPAGAAGLQQHVHHHFHHVEGGEGAGAKVPSVPIPIGAGQAINTDFTSLAQSSTAFTPQTQGGFTQSSAFTAGFNGASQGGLLSQVNGFGAIQKPNGDLYKPSAGLGSFGGAGAGSFGGASGGLYQQGSAGDFGQTDFGGQSQASNSYHSQNPDYFKKELHNIGGISGAQNFNGISTGYDGQAQYQQGFDTARQQIVDCQCVPFNQCPAADRIGRKEDLILPIDPRNLGKDIEALSDDAAANITTNANTEQKSDNDNKSDDESKRARRQATAEDKQSDDNVNLPIDAEGRQGANNLLPALQAIELIQRKILPTYGVSFGLPYPSTGYPPNALGDYYPARNPYFGSIGPNGLNLGLVNVNPLVSVQVQKTEYGDSVVKPLVNLHVTPNENILQKVNDFFKRPAEIVQSSHYHHHDHYTGFGHDHHHHHPSHIEHLPATGPFYEMEMIHSKPIFEYHSGPIVTTLPVPAPQHHHQHYESQHFGQTSYGQTGYAQQSGQVLGTQYYPGVGLGSSGFATVNSPAAGYSGANGYDAVNSYAGGYVGANSYSNGFDNSYERSSNISTPLTSKYQEFPVQEHRRGKQLNLRPTPTPAPGAAEGSAHITFPKDRRRRQTDQTEAAAVPGESVLARSVKAEERAYYGNRPVEKTCRVNEVCCRRPFRPPQQQQLGRCGTRNAAGITGRIKNPVYVDGDSEFGEYPWHVAILKKDPKESIYACGGTLIDAQHVITAAHCIKSQNGFDLRARLGEWDVNHDVEFFPYIERDVVSVHINPEYYAGTLENDLAILKLDHPVDFTKNPHISPACLPDKFADFSGARCWTTGWGKDAFGEHGKYQNILKEVDVPILSHHQCETQLRQTRLGYSYKLNPGFLCAGGEEGKDACKGDGGGPLVCERNGVWNVVGVVSWGIGCGQVNVPGVYVRVAHYLDWIRQITQYYK